jgi:hypothetical protein
MLFFRNTNAPQVPLAPDASQQLRIMSLNTIFYSPKDNDPNTQAVFDRSRTGQRSRRAQAYLRSLQTMSAPTGETDGVADPADPAGQFSLLAAELTRCANNQGSMQPLLFGHIAPMLSTYGTISANSENWFRSDSVAFWKVLRQYVP